MSKQVTITISDAQASEINELMLHMRDTGSLTAAVARCVDAGITQLKYRYAHNAKKVQKDRENKQLLQMLLRERDEMKARVAALEDADEIVARD